MEPTALELLSPIHSGCPLHGSLWVCISSVIPGSILLNWTLPHRYAPCKSPSTRQNYFRADARIPDGIPGMDWVSSAAGNIVRLSVALISFGGDYYASANAAAASLVDFGVTTVVAAGDNNGHAPRPAPPT